MSPGVNHYDHPRPQSTNSVASGYDCPRAQSSFIHQNNERHLSAIPNQRKHSYDSHIEQQGKRVSENASSGSLDSSLTRREVQIRQEEAKMLGYDVPKHLLGSGSASPHVSQSDPSFQLGEELRRISGLMEEQRMRNSSSSGFGNRVTPDRYDIHSPGRYLSAGVESKRSSSSNQESSSSRSGSNDNLGVWDDVSFEESSSDSEFGSNSGLASSDGNEGGTQDTEKGEELLDSWIKELESGIQSISQVAGIPTSRTSPVLVS